MSACSIKSIKCTCIISQCLPHNGSLSRAVPEEANKGPSLSETIQVIQKEPNTILCVCMRVCECVRVCGPSPSEPQAVISPSQEKKGKRAKKRAARYLFLSPAQVPYFKRQRDCRRSVSTAKRCTVKENAVPPCKSSKTPPKKFQT